MQIRPKRAGDSNDEFDWSRVKHRSHGRNVYRSLEKVLDRVRRRGARRHDPTTARDIKESSVRRGPEALGPPQAHIGEVAARRCRRRSGLAIAGRDDDGYTAAKQPPKLHRERLT